MHDQKETTQEALQQALLRLRAAVKSSNGTRWDDVNRTIEILTHVTALSGPLRDAPGLEKMLAQALAPHDKDVPDAINRGFRGLDEPCPYFSDDLIVVLGDTGVGKTQYVLNIAAYNAAEGRHVGVVELEMRGSMIMKRILSSRTGVPIKNIMRDSYKGGRRGEQFAVVEQEANRITEMWNLDILDAMHASLGEIVPWVRQRHEGNPFDLLVIDHFHLIGAVGLGQDEAGSLAQLANSMKQLQVAVGCPMIVVAQVPKNVMQFRVRDGLGVAIPRKEDVLGTKQLSSNASIVECLGADWSPLHDLGANASAIEKRQVFQNGLNFYVDVDKSRGSEPLLVGLMWDPTIQRIWDTSSGASWEDGGYG